MTISEKPTSHILVKAHCHSEWDSCNFAIVSCGDGWAREIAQRMDAVRLLEAANDFYTATFWDCSASFYVAEEEVEYLLPDGKDWAFVELDEDEEEGFSVPENALDCYMMVLGKDGWCTYQAYGKHTSEEFHTEDLPISEIIASMQ